VGGRRARWQGHRFPPRGAGAWGESIVFSWIVWPSREARDEGNKKVMADPRMQPTGGDMPFDMKRMIVGGFTPIVQTGSNP
jgi:uncharacterized protein YbaA (DUF1428 family)